MESNNKYAPTLVSEEEINQMVKELSDPKLKPKPFSRNWKKILADKKVDNADELAETIAKEREEFYQAGLAAGKSGKKAAQIL